MAKRLTQSTTSQTVVQSIGLDIGYGEVKVVSAQTAFKFPSVCGHARDTKFQEAEIAAKHPGEALTDDEGQWFLGDRALTHISTGELLRLRARTADEAGIGNTFRRRMAKGALAKLYPNLKDGSVIHVRIATGLPVDHMPDAEGLRTALLGQHYIRTDNTDFIVNVIEVMVMPQPYGTIYSQTLTNTGDLNPCHTFLRTGVIDVGTVTVDLALDDDGEFVDIESGSIESGVFTAQERIAALLERDHRQKIPFKLVEETLRTGCFRASGESIDYSADVQQALNPLRSATLGLVGEKWKTGTTVDVIYLSGGGAELVYETVSAAYRQTQLVKNAQLANARGYLNYALFRA